MPNKPATTAPSRILIIGAGEFGLSTTLSLLARPAYASTTITLLDSSAQLPNPSGSSVDASRIIRADYGNAVYARLAAKAQEFWRDRSADGWGGEGRYEEPGFLLTADENEGEGEFGEGGRGYVKKSLGNVKDLLEGESGRKGVVELEGREEILRESGLEGVSGRWGYVNRNSGWADAEGTVRWALGRVEGVEGRGRVEVRRGCRVERLLRVRKGEGGGSQVVGVRLEGGEEVKADLTVLAAGAWSPSLLDLQGRCVATAQVLCYVDITQEEQDRLGGNPTVMNLSRGMFIIPPRGKELKVARHGYGYRNLVKIEKGKLLAKDEDEGVYEVSVPKVGIQAPEEGTKACREALREMLPSIAERPFKNTRLCWYCDTPDGDFLITYHPTHEGLFVATGGSGHGFKFFPNIGEKIVDAIEGRLEEELRHAWRWREEVSEGFEACDDGSRAGPRGMLLDEELSKGVQAHL